MLIKREGRKEKIKKDGAVGAVLFEDIYNIAINCAINCGILDVYGTKNIRGEKCAQTA